MIKSEYTKNMPLSEVIEILKLMKKYNIEIHIDGGWGVDALLGEQTRIHNDLDIAIQHKDVSLLRKLLLQKGYKEAPRDDSRDCNFVLADEKGHEIDVHSYTFDSEGSLIFGVPYPLESLSGTGIIGDYPVKCISPEWMVKFHSGYELDQNDYHDVKALCEKFNIPLPPEYDTFF